MVLNERFWNNLVVNIADEVILGKDIMNIFRFIVDFEYNVLRVRQEGTFF